MGKQIWRVLGGHCSPRSRQYPDLGSPRPPCVQELEKLGLGDSVDLHVYEIPVEYQTVQRLIPELWAKHSPQVSRWEVARVLSTESRLLCPVSVQRT